ncbi:MAG: hypothetical protein ACE5LU_18140 [Anaerolineae bacterium]
MRILYLIPGPMGRSPEGRAEVERRGNLLRSYAAPFTEVGIEDVAEVPVLNPARVSLKFAEALVGAGLTHSRRAYMTPPKLAMGEVGSALNLLHSHLA